MLIIKCLCLDISDCFWLFYASKYVSVIKRIVLKSPFLWRNGIEKKGMTIGYSFIDITGISNQIDFTATEMEVLWEKMKVSLYQIKEVCNNQKEEESTFFINHCYIIR